MKGETRPRARMVRTDNYQWIQVARPFSTLTAVERGQVLDAYRRNPKPSTRSYIVQDDCMFGTSAGERATAKGEPR